MAMNRLRMILLRWGMGNVILNCLRPMLQPWRMSNVILNRLGLLLLPLGMSNLALNSSRLILLSWRMSNVALNCLVSPAITLNRGRYVSARTINHSGNNVSKNKVKKLENKGMAHKARNSESCNFIDAVSISLYHYFYTGNSGRIQV